MNHIWTINCDPQETFPAFVKDCFMGVKPYLERFLTSKHPHRNGVMCPFMPKALASNEIYFSYFEKSGTHEELIRRIEECVIFYKTRQRKTPGALIILFEPEFEIERLLRAHIDAKITCIKNELMLGALYKDSPAPSLHSDDYFPLRTPTPTLVIRDLTSQDLLFLNPAHYNIREKLGFLNSFIRKFDNADSKGYASKQVDIAKSMRSAYRNALFRRAALTTLAIVAAVTFALTYIYH